MRLAAILIAVMLAAPAWAEEVLYCTDTANTGFYWDKGSSEGERTGFKPKRYIVKIISETERIVTPMTGDSKGFSKNYTCRRHDEASPDLVQRGLWRRALVVP